MTTFENRIFAATYDQAIYELELEEEKWTLVKKDSGYLPDTIIVYRMDYYAVGHEIP